MQRCVRQQKHKKSEGVEVCETAKAQKSEGVECGQQKC